MARERNRQMQRAVRRVKSTREWRKDEPVEGTLAVIRHQKASVGRSTDPLIAR